MTTPRLTMGVFTLITMIALAFTLATNTPDCAINGGR